VTGDSDPGVPTRRPAVPTLTLTAVIKTYKFVIGGAQVNSAAVKKIGYFETTGCKGKRAASVTFTAEDGTATPAKGTVGSC
jgi:hypothetical protein